MLAQAYIWTDNSDRTATESWTQTGVKQLEVNWLTDWLDFSSPNLCVN